MAFDNLNAIPDGLEVMKFEHSFKVKDFQKYQLILQVEKKGQPWVLFVDEFAWRNEIIMKKKRDMVYCQDVRMNVYAFALALLTDMPLKTLLRDEAAVASHFQRLKTSMSDVEDMRKKGAPVDEFAAYLLNVSKN